MAHVDIVVYQVDAESEGRDAHHGADEGCIRRFEPSRPKKQQQCHAEEYAVIVVIINHHGRRPRRVMYEDAPQEYGGQCNCGCKISFAEMVGSVMVEVQSDVAAYKEQEYKPWQ